MNTRDLRDRDIIGALSGTFNAEYLKELLVHWVAHDSIVIREVVAERRTTTLVPQL